ncbi:MAG: hypothetical protein ABIW79_07800, partial [Gemmatimonas sp.]
MTLSIDFTNMMATALPNGGISETEWRDAATAFEAAHASVESLRASGTLGFLGLPTNAPLLDATLAVAE